MPLFIRLSLDMRAFINPFHWITRTEVFFLFNFGFRTKYSENLLWFQQICIYMYKDLCELNMSVVYSILYVLFVIVVDIIVFKYEWRHGIRSNSCYWSTFKVRFYLFIIHIFEAVIPSSSKNVIGIVK